MRLPLHRRISTETQENHSGFDTSLTCKNDGFLSGVEAPGGSRVATNRQVIEVDPAMPSGPREDFQRRAFPSTDGFHLRFRRVEVGAQQTGTRRLGTMRRQQRLESSGCPALMLQYSYPPPSAHVCTSICRRSAFAFCVDRVGWLRFGKPQTRSERERTLGKRSIRRIENRESGHLG